MTSTHGLDIKNNREEHRFEAALDGGALGIAEYRLDGDTIEFTHTKVPSAFEGQGIGSALIRTALASARERGLKVIPTCPFFAAYMRKHAETQDLLTPESRRSIGLE